MRLAGLLVACLALAAGVPARTAAARSSAGTAASSAGRLALAASRATTRTADRSRPKGPPAKASPVPTPSATPRPTAPPPPTPLPEAVATLETTTRDRRVQPVAGEPAIVFGPWEYGGWADVFRSPSGDSERIAQALLGDIVNVDRLEGAWARVADHGKTWSGWVRTAELTRGSLRVARAYSDGPRVFLVRAPGLRSEGRLFLPFGAELPLAGSGSDGRVRLLLPDGRTAALTKTDKAVSSRPLSLSASLDRTKGLVGYRYANGGNSRDSVDGPGLVWLVHRVAGIRVPRTLDGLRSGGRPVVAKSERAGDVLFLRVYDPDRPQPGIVLEPGQTYLQASPGNGVSLGFIDDASAARIVARSRFRNGTEAD